MGKYDIVPQDLESSIVRISITGEGKKRLISRAATSGAGAGGLFGVVKNIFSSLLNLGKWIIKGVISSVGFTFTSVWGFIVSTTVFIYNFNWNITDESIEANYQSIVNSLASQYGSAVGSALGTLACGAAPGALLFLFNEPLALYLLKEVGEEAISDFTSGVNQLLRSTAFSVAEIYLYQYFKNARRLIKYIFDNPASPQSKLLRTIFGKGAEKAIDAWGEQGTEPWSFRIFVDESIDSIENPVLRNFTESLLEDFFEKCVEVGYVIAGSLDTWLLQQRQMKDSLLGDEKVVTVQPDRTQDEVLILAGKTEMLKPAITGTITTYEQVKNRDLGQFVGTKVFPTIKKPVPGIAVKVIFSSNKFEMNWSQGEIIADYTIPNFDRKRLKWLDIKTACGGENGYLWGNYRATLNTEEGNQIAVYGGTEQSAVSRAEAFLSLSNDHLYTMNVTRETDKGARSIAPNENSLVKNSGKIYPIFCYIINYEKTYKENIGRKKREGNYRTRKYRLPLWTTEEPPEWDDIVTEITATATE